MTTQIDLYLQTLEDNPRDTRVFAMLWAEAAAGDRDLRPIFTELDAEFRASTARLLRTALPEGADASPDPTALAAWIVGQLRGIALQRVLAGNEIDLAALRRSIDAVLRHGLRPGPPSPRSG